MKNTTLFTLAMAGVLAVGIALPSYASSVTPIDVAGLALHDGDVISAVDSGDPDVFIIKLDAHGDYLGYKRLFLNPIIFSFYGHLGGFSKVRHVTPAVRDAFETSGLFRNCETNAAEVWAVQVTGEDTAMFHHVAVTGDAAVAQDPSFFRKVFCINDNEENWYGKSADDYTSLDQIPRYSRVGYTPMPGVSATPTPSITPTTTPTPGATPADQPTITGVQTRYPNGLNGTPRVFTVTVSGTVPTSCHNLSDFGITSGADRVDLTLTMTAPASTAYCNQTPQPFEQAVEIQNYIMWGQVYGIYVNGVQYWSGQIGQ